MTALTLQNILSQNQSSTIQQSNNYQHQNSFHPRQNINQPTTQRQTIYNIHQQDSEEIFNNYNQLLNLNAQSRHHHHATYSRQFFQDQEQRHLHQKILTLYDLIQEKTLANLLLKKENDDLQLQIKTINQIRQRYINFSFHQSQGNPEKPTIKNDNEKNTYNNYRNSGNKLTNYEPQNKNVNSDKNSERPTIGVNSQTSIMKLKNRNEKMVSNAKMKTINTQGSQFFTRDRIQDNGLQGDQESVNDKSKCSDQSRSNKTKQKINQLQQQDLQKKFKQTNYIKNNSRNLCYLNQKILSKNLKQIFDHMKNNEQSQQKHQISSRNHTNISHQNVFYGDSFNQNYDSVDQNSSRDEINELSIYSLKKKNQEERLNLQESHEQLFKPQSSDFFKKERKNLYNYRNCQSKKQINTNRNLSNNHNQRDSYLILKDDKKTTRLTNLSKDQSNQFSTKRRTFLSPRNNIKKQYTNNFMTHKNNFNSQKVFNQTSALRSVRSIQDLWNHS